MKQTLVYKVVELFRSVQGEGFWAGKPMIFIRFAGCNLGKKTCPWCDTDFTKFTPMTLPQIVKKVNSYLCKRVCLTGGEAVLQDIKPLCEELMWRGFWIALETNGVKTLYPFKDYTNWITLSPKTKVTTNNVHFADELKFVIDKENYQFPIPLPSPDKKLIYFQPQGNKPRFIKEALRLLEKYPECSLSLQLQKIIKVK